MRRQHLPWFVLSVLALLLLTGGCSLLPQTASPPSSVPGEPGSPSAPPHTAPPSPAQALHGWAVGFATHGCVGCIDTPVVLHAHNGKVWSLEPSGLGKATLHQVLFVNRQNGWILGTDETADASIVLTTTDAGRTWRAQSVPGSAAKASLHGVYFLRPSAGS